MLEVLKDSIVWFALLGFAALALGPVLWRAGRALARQGVLFALICSGFLVSMATKPTPPPEPPEPAVTNTVEFVLGDCGLHAGGGALVQQVEEGGDAVAPVVRASEGWEFAQWDRPFTNVVEDLTVNAEYTNTVYAITYVDEFAAAHANPSTFTVTNEIDFAAPAAVEGYDFAGWTPSGIALGTTGDVTVVANWTAKPAPPEPPDPPEPVATNTVEFVLDEDCLVRVGGGELVQFVASGGGATVPDVVAYPGCRFTGWDRPFDVVTNDLRVTALWEEVAPTKAEDWIGKIYVPTNDDGIPEGRIVVESGTAVAISVAGLPKGLAYDKGSESLVYDETKMKDGSYAFVVSAKNANGYRTDRVVSFVTDGHTGEKDPLDWGETYFVGKAYRIACDEFTALSAKDSLTLTGLPAGLKLVKDKDGNGWPVYRIEGMPTKAGRFTVTWNETHAQAKVATQYYMTVDGAPSRYVEACEDNLPAGCKVTGSGVYAAGTKITLKATAKKGYVFAGWYQDETFDLPVEASTDYRSPTLTLAESSNWQPAYYPRFIEVRDDFCDGIGISDWDMGSVPKGEILVESGSLPTVTVSGLPAGLTFDRKTNTLVFNEAKMRNGDYAFVITAKNAGGYVYSRVVTFGYGMECEEPRAAYQVGQIVSEALGFEAETTKDKLTLTGLPKGLKLVASYVLDEEGQKLPHYALEGVPAAAGRYRVKETSVVDGEKASDEFFIFVDGAPSQYVEVVTDGTVGCKATGSGVVAAGGSLKTTATPGKDYVFAGWYVEEGEDELAPFDNVHAEFQGKDGDCRLASQAWLCGLLADEDQGEAVETVPRKLVACFAKKAEDALGSDAIAVLDEAGAEIGADVAWDVRIGESSGSFVTVDSVSAPKLTVKGSVPGVTVKNVGTHAKLVYDPAGKSKAKAGEYVLTLTAVNQSKATATRTLTVRLED